MANNQGINQGHDLFLDILTKEEKEAMVTKKMEEIRRKNQKWEKRYEEIEADKRQAETHLVIPKGTPPVISASAPKAHNMKGVGNADEAKKKFAVGRGKKLQQMSRETLKAPEYEAKRKSLGGGQKPPRSPGGMPRSPGGPPVGYNRPDQDFRTNTYRGDKPFVEMREHRNDWGDSRQVTMREHRGDRGDPRLKRESWHGQQKRDSWHEKDARKRDSWQETRGEWNNQSDEKNAPPPDPVFNFLSDRSREGPLNTEVMHHEDVSRHPRNFGGTDFGGVKDKVKIEKERQHVWSKTQAAHSPRRQWTPYSRRSDVARESRRLDTV